ncbi:Polyribonucleotide nucleotidyltransferase OS=Lysinibacillus sphaericus CBAM5 OX=1400869 GN=pnp PE=3 SV=1 [Lysinibacillus sphaericus]
MFKLLTGLGVEESKRFMHHYNFPQFSVGKLRLIRGNQVVVKSVTVLEVKRALEAVIPDESAFPIHNPLCIRST